MPSFAELQQAISVLEAQHDRLDPVMADISLTALRRQLGQLQSPPPATTSTTLMHVRLSSNLGTTDTTASGKLLGTLYQLQKRFKMMAAQHGGDVDTDTGYDVVAVFESETPRDSAVQAVESAMQIVAAAQQLEASTSSTNHGPSFGVHIGLHTTPPTDTNNHELHQHVAKRLADMARPNEILVSHHTYQRTRGRFTAHSGRPLTIEEFGEPLSTYLVSEINSVLHRLAIPDEIHGITVGLVGRASELRQLQEALHKVAGERHAQWVTIVGEAGIGKTRLMAEYFNWLDLIPEVIWLASGQAMSETTPQPFSLWRDIIANRCNIHHDDSLLVARQKLTMCITDLMGQSNEYKAHFIGHLIGMDYSDSPHLADMLEDPQQIIEHAITYVQHWLEVAQSNTGFPIVIIVENVQWADDQSLAMLQHLAAQTINLPLLVLITARPTFYDNQPDWGDALPYHQRLDLAPLSDRAMNLLVAELLRNVPDLPREFVQQIVLHAAGNPSYVWGYVRLLIEDEVIVPGPDQWDIHLSHLDDAATLLSLTEVITTRLQRLQPYALRVLEWAAVIGQTFWDRAVVDMVAQDDFDQDGTRQMLKLLESQQLILPQQQSSFAKTTEYRFSHPAVYQVVYEQIPPDQRQEQHGRVAVWLIGRSMDRISQFAGSIASHYRLAGKTQRAIKWYGMAGAQAEATYATQTASQHYKQALELLKAHPSLHMQRDSILRGLGATLTLQARFTEAIGIYQDMLEATDSPIEKAHACNRLSDLYNHIGNAQAALTAAQEAEILAEQGRDESRVELARAWLCQGKTHLHLGEGHRAKNRTREARMLSETIGDDSLLTDCLTVMGTILMTIESDLDGAVAFYAQALGIARRLGNRRYEGILANNVAEIANMRGEYEEALQLFQEAERIAVETGSRLHEMIIACNISAAHIGLYDYQNANLRLQRTFPTIEVSGFMDQTLKALTLQSMVQIGLGKYSEALKLTQKALALARQHKLVGEEVVAWRVLGTTLAALGNAIIIEGHAYDARASFQQSLGMSERLNLAYQHITTQSAWAEYELTTGDRAHGKALCQAAMNWYAKVGAPRQVERIAAMQTSLAPDDAT